MIICFTCFSETTLDSPTAHPDKLLCVLSSKTNDAEYTASGSRMEKLTAEQV